MPPCLATHPYLSLLSGIIVLARSKISFDHRKWGKWWCFSNGSARSTVYVNCKISESCIKKTTYSSWPSFRVDHDFLEIHSTVNFFREWRWSLHDPCHTFCECRFGNIFNILSVISGITLDRTVFESLRFVVSFPAGNPTLTRLIEIPAFSSAWLIAALLIAFEQLRYLP